jgi:hypothetical protein
MSTVSKEQLIATEKGIEVVKDYLLTDMPTEEFVDEFCYIEN